MNINKRLKAFLDLLLLVALFWVVRYWHSRQFGLYEDDLTIIPNAFSRSFSSLINYILSYITHFYGHARPLSDSAIYFFSWIGWHLAGLWGPYLIGYLITIINICLFYWLMRRVASRPFALIAGLAYLLYSADTTQAFLTHSLGVQPSVTLVFLAMHAYLSNKRILAYLLAFVVLFSYEVPFLLFAAIPLLKKTWNKKLLKEFLVHVAIVAVMLGAIYIFRSIIGDSRVADLTMMGMLVTPILHMLEGPVVSLGTFAYRPIQALRGIDLQIGVTILLTFGLLLWILLRLDITTRLNFRDLVRAVKDPAARRALPEEVTSIGRLLLAGFLMLVMAYPLTFTVKVYAISGRETRAHFAGVAGAAMLVSSAAILLLYMTTGVWRKLVTALIALELALMAGYGFVIQRDYVNAWQYQRQFWTELVPLIPDASDGTNILIDPATLHDTLQIGANDWNTPRVLNQLYLFPDDVRRVPIVHRMKAAWQNNLAGLDGKFQLSGTTVTSPQGYDGEFNPQDVILIQAENGHLVRRTTITLNGQAYALKPASASVLPGLPHGLLYQLMIIQP